MIRSSNRSEAFNRPLLAQTCGPGSCHFEVSLNNATSPKESAEAAKNWPDTLVRENRSFYKKRMTIATVTFAETGLPQALRP